MFDLAAEVRKETIDYFADGERMRLHYEALAQHHGSVPTPSWLKGDKAKEFRAWHEGQRAIALDKAKGFCNQQ